MNLFYDLWLPVVVIAYRAALGGGSGTAVRPEKLIKPEGVCW
jgi:hypothetical protein